MAQGVDFAIFDSDNHLYETEDSLTRHLPATHRDLIRFVEVRGRKKLVVRDRLTEFIPNPTFEVAARPGDPEHPREVFHRNVWVNPFWEDSVTGLVDLIGADRVCFGSDYPHPEGLDDPVAWRHELDGVPAADVERIMSTNMFGLLGVTPPATRAA
jgi:predicted TIM-barrel fold metal-dependent hydrolase